MVQHGPGRLDAILWVYGRMEKPRSTDRRASGATYYTPMVVCCVLCAGDSGVRLRACRIAGEYECEDNTLRVWLRRRGTTTRSR